MTLKRLCNLASIYIFICMLYQIVLAWIPVIAVKLCQIELKNSQFWGIFAVHLTLKITLKGKGWVASIYILIFILYLIDVAWVPVLITNICQVLLENSRFWTFGGIFWSFWPCNWPWTLKTEKSSTHILIFVLYLIDVAWMTAINTKQDYIIYENSHFFPFCNFMTLKMTLKGQSQGVIRPNIF